MNPFHFESEPGPHAGKVIDVPANLDGKADLLAFLQRAIPLPDYFGHNWDALDECLHDLAERERIVLRHADLPLESAPDDQRAYVRLLADAARDTSHLFVIFPEDFRAKVMQLLSPPPARQAR